MPVPLFRPPMLGLPSPCPTHQDCQPQADSTPRVFFPSKSLHAPAVAGWRTVRCARHTTSSIPRTSTLCRHARQSDGSQLASGWFPLLTLVSGPIFPATKDTKPHSMTKVIPKQGNSAHLCRVPARPANQAIVALRLSAKRISKGHSVSLRRCRKSAVFRRTSSWSAPRTAQNRLYGHSGSTRGRW